MGTQKTVFSGLFAVAACALMFVTLRDNVDDSRHDEKVVQAPSSAAKFSSHVTNDEAQAQFVVGDQKRTNNLVSVRDPDKKLSFKFSKAGNDFRADGVRVSSQGEVEVASRYTDGNIRAKLVSAHLSELDNQIPRASGKAEATNSKTHGSVMLSSFFEGVDVEYRYDGSDVEEFFHISDDLKNQIARSEGDLIVRSIVPGVFRHNGDEIMSAQENVPLHAGAVQGVIGEASEFGATKYVGGVTLTTVEGDRFGLPAAVAVDDASHSLTLARTFEWVDEGLQIDVHLPAKWVRETAKGKVVIDPSIIDANRAVRIRTWNESNLVRDSQGNIHLAFNGVYGGRWSILRSKRNASTGLWDPPSVVQNQYATSENTFYSPSLAIDSNDTLHATWGDHGYIPNEAALKGAYTSWGHRVRYSSCANRCDSGNSWSGATPQEQLIAPTNYRHQAYYHIAVSGSGNGATANDAHVSFLEWDHSYDTSMPYERTRHFQFRNNVKTEMANIPISDPNTGSNRNRYATHLAWGADNALWAILSQYEWDRDIKTYSWNGSNDTWTAGPTTKLWHPRNSGRNMHQHRMQCSAGNTSNLLHCTWNVYYWEGDDAWGIGYGALNTNSRAWQDTQHVSVLPTTPLYHEQHPTITTQNDNVYVFWYRSGKSGYSKLPNIRAASKSSSSSSFTAAYDFTGQTKSASQVRALPRLNYPPSMKNHGNPAWEIVVALEDFELNYYSPETTISAPQTRFPTDGTFMQASGGGFGWQAPPEDSGDSANQGVHQLQVATEPSFRNIVLSRNVNGNGGQMSEMFGSWVPPEDCYYWRIRVTSPVLQPGEWSETKHFCIDTTPPNPFAPLSPANGVDPQTNTPRFTWNPAVDPD